MRKSPILTACGLLFAALPCLGQVSITFSGTASNNALGYTIGQECSFTYVVSTADLSGSVDAGNSYTWSDEISFLDNDLWESISGSGLTGTWTRPSSGFDDPLSSLAANDLQNTATCFASSDNSSPLGLIANEEHTIGYIVMHVTTSIFDGRITEADLPDATVFWSSMVGSYAVTNYGLVSCYVATVSYSDQAFFNITNMTITAVPEPADYGVMAGAGAIGLAFFARRRQRRV